MKNEISNARLLFSQNKNNEALAIVEDLMKEHKVLQNIYVRDDENRIPDSKEAKLARKAFHEHPRIESYQKAYRAKEKAFQKQTCPLYHSFFRNLLPES